MARKHNFLLGHGERLTGKVDVRTGGGDKNPPYPFLKAKERVTTRAKTIATQVADLPDAACPGDEVVLAITMHPRYISKSDFPDKLLNTLGLRTVGTRARRVAPENWGIDKHPEDSLTDEIFVAAHKDSVRGLERLIGNMTVDSVGADDLSHVEDISMPTGRTKLKNLGTTPAESQRWLEVVLHNRGRVDVLTAFTKYAQSLGTVVDLRRSRNVGGLTFVPVASDAKAAEKLADFSFLRVARSMPTLRPLSPSIIRANIAVSVPTADPVTGSCRALIFDGGIPSGVLSALQPWVTLIEPSGIGPSVPRLEEHGLGVTSAFLFGPILNPEALARPICPVDHVRVLDASLLTSTDPYYFDVLDRMLEYFDAEKHEYDLINMSVGPRLPVDDDDVTLWTASWDQRLSNGEWIVTAATGNDGDGDAASGSNRIQPPSDGVNLLSVGACDKSNGTWARSTYSCVGPGRRPGFGKPDGVIFGGSNAEQFPVLLTASTIQDVQGTSFAAPFALRLAATVKAQLGSDLNSLAVRALMIHQASNDGLLPTAEIGWGRFELDPERLITCEDHEAIVIYQDELKPNEYLRVKIPIPVNSTEGNVELEATLVLSTEVDPANASSYTRRGAEVFFRPHSQRFGKPYKGKRPVHPKTAQFISARNLYGASELNLREEGFKWEPCRRSKITMRSGSLHEPCFDIHNHHRAHGVASDAVTDTKYALVVTVRAPRVKDFYDRVVRAYANILVPLQPQVQIKVSN
jgi:hypothetical protein